MSKKDYEYAKQVFLKNKRKKTWTAAFRTSKKIKDKDFNNLVWWIYLKEKNNKATLPITQDLLIKIQIILELID